MYIKNILKCQIFKHFWFRFDIHFREYFNCLVNASKRLKRDLNRIYALLKYKKVEMFEVFGNIRWNAFSIAWNCSLNAAGAKWNRSEFANAKQNIPFTKAAKHMSLNHFSGTF